MLSGSHSPWPSVSPGSFANGPSQPFVRFACSRMYSTIASTVFGSASAASSRSVARAARTSSTAGTLPLAQYGSHCVVPRSAAPSPPSRATS